MVVVVAVVGIDMDTMAVVLGLDSEEGIVLVVVIGLLPVVVIALAAFVGLTMVVVMVLMMRMICLTYY
jgi:hypothetical protein